MSTPPLLKILPHLPASLDGGDDVVIRKGKGSQPHNAERSANRSMELKGPFFSLDFFIYLSDVLAGIASLGASICDVF